MVEVLVQQVEIGEWVVVAVLLRLVPLGKILLVAQGVRGLQIVSQALL
jgi:hypothetical protein